MSNDETVRDMESVEQVVAESTVLNSTGLVRTFFIFSDLTIRYEFRVSDGPYLPTGSEICLKMNLRNPKNPSRIRKIDGVYRVEKCKIVYSNEIASKTGWSQYLDLRVIEEH